MNIILSSVGVILAVVYGFVLFKLGQDRDRNLLFYLMALVPVIPLVVWGLLTLGIVFSWSFLSTYWILFVILAIERLFWSFLLKDSAELDHLRWFYLIYTVPFIGWMVYAFTKLK
jgi:hypothetical protein